MPKIQELIDNNNRLKHESKQKDMLFEQHENKYEQATTTLEDEMEKLKQDIKEKESFIKRLKRQTQDFEDEVFTTEQNFAVTIGEQKTEIINLNEKMMKLRHMTEELQQKIKLFETRMQQSQIKEEQLCTKISHLNDIKVSMTTTIEALSEDNKAYVSEVEDLRAKLLAFQYEKSYFHEKVSVSVQTDSGDDSRNCETENIETCAKPNTKVIVFTDTYGKFLYGPLKRELGDNTDLQVICKPNATFKVLISHIESYLNDFTENDFVIVLAGFPSSITFNDLSFFIK